MELKSLLNELQRLTALVEGWNGADDIPAVERDLALAKLRNLYEMLRFSPHASAAPDEAREAAPLAVSIDLGEVMSLEEPSDEEEDPFSLETLPPSESPVAEPLSEPFPVADAPVSELAPAPESSPEPAPAPAPAPESSPEPAPAPASESAPEPDSDVAPASARSVRAAAQTLFGVEEATVRHKHKQRVIMSLYDYDLSPSRPESGAPPAVSVSPDAPRPVGLPADEPLNEPAATAPAAPVAVPTMPAAAEVFGIPVHPDSAGPAASYAPDGNAAAEPAAPLGPGSDGGSLEDGLLGEEDPFEEITCETAPAPEQDETADEGAASSVSRQPLGPVVAEMSPQAAVTVLGDVINHDVQTLADTIVAPRDIASELRRSEPVTDLYKAIGINDKFLMIRDLFGGDSASYEVAIRALNDLESLDDCMIYIAEHYAWNANSDGAKLLVELLERKFA